MANRALAKSSRLQKTDRCEDWRPALGLRNGHIQSLLSAAELRKPFVRLRAKKVIERAEEMVFECSEGVRMQGLLSKHDHRPRPLVALIHGWEGCVDSLYLLSIAGYLYQQGYDIFRLHLRDHGPTLSLNRDIFHACRLDEVGEALAQMQTQISPPSWTLVGFSLGGNFSLRVAANASKYGLSMQRVVGISALLDGKSTLSALQAGLPVYRNYFVKKWCRSIRKKARLFPDIVNDQAFCASGDLSEMTDYFVRHHTPYRSPDDYFRHYALNENQLSQLEIPAWLILSEDDPVIPVKDLAELNGSHLLKIVRSPYGGHCGFIENYRLEAWIDRFVATILAE